MRFPRNNLFIFYGFIGAFVLVKITNTGFTDAKGLTAVRALEEPQQQQQQQHGSHHGSHHGSRQLPHIIYILADDFGYADCDWHRGPSWNETSTPFLHSLLKEGVELDRMYSYKFCSPSRSALQSGRNPIHSNVQNLDPTYGNHTTHSYAGIPRNMTGLGEVMKKANYATHFVGKWDCGMATFDHTPTLLPLLPPLLMSMPPPALSPRPRECPKTV